MDPLLTTKRLEIEALCRRCGVVRLYVFGSAALGERRSDSDFDFAYELIDEHPVSYGNRYFDLWFGLEKLLGANVDLVSAAAQTNPYFLEALFSTQQLYYETQHRIVPA
jgi:uncharacterized protein